MDAANLLSQSLQSRARLAGYDPDRLDATVLVAGMGALGQNLALNLALSGIRELRLVDADSFEAHNRTRSPLYPRTAAEGAAKAPSTASMLRDVATHQHARIRYAEAWIEDLGAGIFRDVDVVVSCVDSTEARAYLSARCALLGLPLVEAGFEGPDVSVALFLPPADSDTAPVACWSCGSPTPIETMSCRLRAAAAEAANVVPAIQTAAATAGGLQAEAVIEVLHGRVDEARRLWLNVRTGQSMTAILRADAACPGPHRRATTPVRVGASIDTLLGELIDIGSNRLAGEPVLELPSPWIEQGVCVSCDRPIAPSCPGTRYRRQPFCDRCGGPWTAAPVGADVAANPQSRVRHGDALATCPASRVGFAPGDHVLIHDGHQEVLIELEGGPDDLLTDAA